MAVDAKDAVAKAGKGRSIIGWKLDEDQRRELLLMFPPLFERPIADHVTLKTRVARDAQLPCETQGEIIGRAHDGEGVEAMVVQISGTTDRPGGGTYHITWSLAPGRQAKESNDVLARQQWETFDLPVPVQLQPARFG